MAKTNAQRQREWRIKHNQLKTPFGPGKGELTMRFLFAYLYQHGPTPARDLYRKLSAHRDKVGWKWLSGEIIHNGWHGEDKLAPVTCRGSGKRGDYFIFQTSEEWDLERDWDKEQEAPVNKDEAQS